MSNSDEVILQQLREENLRLKKQLRLDHDISQFFSFIEQYSTAATVIFDNNHHILWTNNAFLNLFGYQKKELSHLIATDLAAPESLEQVKQNVSSKTDQEYEAKGIRKDGTTFCARVSANHLVYNGQTARIATIIDITDIKNQQEELERSHHELEAFFTNSVFGIVMLRGGRKIFRANQRVAEMFGYNTPEEIEGREVRDFHLSEEKYETFGKKYYDSLIKKDMMQIEYQIKRKDGSPLWVSISGRAIDPITPPDLNYGVVWIFEDINKRKEMEEQLIKIATTDSLTNCHNRRHFFELAEVKLQESARYKRPLSILVLDIDYFKSVNDNYGHEKGDDILRLFASVCRRNLRSSDIFGRLGGEEFAAILPETGVAQAHQVAEKLRIAIQNCKCSPPITVSIGLAGIDKKKDLKEAVRRADACLYRAKAEGRNQVVHFE